MSRKMPSNETFPSLYIISQASVINKNSGQSLVMLFTCLIVMGFKLFFEYFPVLEIFWLENSDVPDKGQKKDSSSMGSRFWGQENEINLDDLHTSSKSLHVIFY